MTRERRVSSTHAFTISIDPSTRSSLSSTKRAGRTRGVVSLEGNVELLVALAAEWFHVCLGRFQEFCDNVLNTGSVSASMAVRPATRRIPATRTDAPSPINNAPYGATQ